MPVTGPCAIAICKKQSSKWKTVTEYVISKGQANDTFPSYIQLGVNCYNGIVTRSTVEFQQYAQTNTNKTDEINEAMYTDEAIRTGEIENTNPLSFFKAIEAITNILYIFENKEKSQHYTHSMNFRRLWKERMLG
jgi:hypothetical protein